ELVLAPEAELGVASSRPVVRVISGGGKVEIGRAAKGEPAIGPERQDILAAHARIGAKLRQQRLIVLVASEEPGKELETCVRVVTTGGVDGVVARILQQI